MRMHQLADGSIVLTPRILSSFIRMLLGLLLVHSVHLAMFGMVRNETLYLIVVGREVQI